MDSCSVSELWLYCSSFFPFPSVLHAREGNVKLAISNKSRFLLKPKCRNYGLFKPVSESGLFTEFYPAIELRVLA